MSNLGIRTSQRASRSCIECSRRKIRCDKKIPCRPCIQRNVAHECARPVVRVGGKLTVASDSPPAQSTADSDTLGENVAELIKERSALRAQVAQLEFALSSMTPMSRRLATVSENSSAEPNLRLANIEPTLEQYDVGMRLSEKQPSTTTGAAAIRRLWEPSMEPALAMLPDRQASHRLVFWSLKNLGWIPCALRANEFMEQHEDFWNNLGAPQIALHKYRAWLAVYFSLLATSMIYMDSHELPPSEQLPPLPREMQSSMSSSLNLGRLWYEAAIMELKRSDALNCALLETVQATMILTLCHSIFGEFEREQILNGIALQAARGLDMHHLGSEGSQSDKVKSRLEWCTAEARELGRRLWWSLVVCDWLGSWSRAPSISPATFCVQLPGRSITDQDLLPTYISNTTGPVPSPAQYLNTMARLAYIFYVYIVANSHRSLPKLSRALEEIELVRTALPLHLTDHFPANSDDESWEAQHSWVTFQRYLISHVIDFMRLSIARHLLLSSDTGVDENMHGIAIASATRLLEHVRKPVPRMYRIVWMVPASTVAAGIYLSLDHLVKSPGSQVHSDKKKTSELIYDALQTLRHHPEGTFNTAKGCEIINRLSEMADYWQAPPEYGYGEAARLALAQAAENMSPTMQQLAGLNSLDLDFDMASFDFMSTVPIWETSEMTAGMFIQDGSGFGANAGSNSGGSGLW